MDSFSRTIAAARAGDPQAIALLYRRYASRVFTAVRRRLRSDLRQKLDSGDVVQSVFREVMRDLPRFEDRGETAFRHWLYIKAENNVRGKLRKYLGRAGRRREALLNGDLAQVGGSPASEAASREDRVRVGALVGELDQDARSVVLLRLEQSLPFAEIARRLSLASSDAARKRYARALGKIRRSLGDAGSGRDRSPRR